MHNRRVTTAADPSAPAGVCPAAGPWRGPWLAKVGPPLEEATLGIPAETTFLSSGRRGVHSEHLGYLLAEMQCLPRAYPGARW